MLDPQLREKLLVESQQPLRGLRRVIWLAGLGSAFIGLLVMLLRLSFGEQLLLKDAIIQITAILLFSSLLWVEKK